MLNEDEFTLLYQLSSRWRPTVDSINQPVQSLIQAGESLKNKGLVADHKLTIAGERVLATYKVDNAIIMAAGKSSRFAPVCYTMPKGLVRFKNEILIERQIEQLQAAGINDITVVVGYKKEQFFYLKEKYQVKIVINADFDRYNNISTLYLVRKQLGNTYICSSDNYFAKNVFAPYNYQAYYATVWASGKTTEYCINANAEQRITSVTIGGADSWIMLGQAYFTRYFSQKFRQIIEAAYQDPVTRELLWEQLYIKHIDFLPLYQKKYSNTMIFEFDTVAELLVHDADFWENNPEAIAAAVDRQAISELWKTVMPEEDSAIVAITPLIGGLTNTNYKITLQSGKQYVLRYPGNSANELIDRHSEYFNEKQIASFNLDSIICYFDVNTGVKITEFIQAGQTLNESTVTAKKNIYQAAQCLKKLHSLPIIFNNTFDCFALIVQYEQLNKVSNGSWYDDYQIIRQQIMSLKHIIQNPTVKLVPCHNDPVPANFIRESDRLYLIDWEYSGMNDPLWDIAALFLEWQLTSHDQAVFWQDYELQPTAMLNQKILALMVCQDFLWSIWSLVKTANGADFTAYGKDRYERAKNNLLKIKL